MMHQYNTQRFQYSQPMAPWQEIKRRGRKMIPGELRYVPAPGSLRRGTFSLGTIIYIQDRIDRFHPPLFRNPWQVVAFTNREYYPCTPDRPDKTFMAGEGSVIVRSLRDGRIQRVSSHHILNAIDNGWEKL